MSVRRSVLTPSRARRPAKANSAQKRPTPLELELQWITLLGQQNLLQQEIQRGEECLQQVQAELAQMRSRLEEWPTYEKSCSRDCLPCLTEAAWSGRRMERFLEGWISRRERQLRTVTTAIARFARQHKPADCPAALQR
jgi:hypothetical protein